MRKPIFSPLTSASTEASRAAIRSAWLFVRLARYSEHAKCQSSRTVRSPSMEAPRAVAFSLRITVVDLGDVE
jgi:hypothetical protein